MKPNGEPDKMDAIRSLYPNVGCTLRNGVIVVWQSDQPQPTEEQIQAKLAELQADYNAKKYQRDSLQEYPSIEECIHAILDDDLEALQAKRTAVKEKYPKPE